MTTTTTRRWLHRRYVGGTFGVRSEVCHLVDAAGWALCGTEADPSFWESGEGWRPCSVCLGREGNGA